MIPKLSSLFLVTTIAMVVVMTVSCATKSSTKDTNGELQAKVIQVEELAKKRQARQNELSVMTVEQLAVELQNESKKGVEPFNSMTYTELVSRGVEAAPELKSTLIVPDRTSFLGLLALHEMSLKDYNELDPSYRATVLVQALQTSKYFNSWGLPHLYWEQPAKVIIGEGEVTRKQLIALLRDNRPAPMWGSDEVIEYQKYNYRVKDYAWGLLISIKGETVTMDPDPSKRDELIAEFLNQPQ